MDRGAAGEPTAKRAKKDKEDPLVRRRKELVLLDASARAEGERRGKELVREAKLEAKRLKQEAKDTFRGDLRAVCAELEAKNEKNFGGRRLPPEVWKKIIDDENVQQNDVIALASTCRFFRDTTKDLGRKLVTNLNPDRLLKLRKSGRITSHSMGWFRWVCDSMEIRPGLEWSWERLKGAVYEGDLLNYAMFQGSVEILRWLMEEKGWELNEHTGKWVGLGGAVEVLASFLRGKGYEFDEEVCAGAARGGHLEALKFLRAQDPPCPWDAETCDSAASGGHLKALKWARAQDPPCPWDAETCDSAASGGHLDVLKWVRAQNPPCPLEDDWPCAFAANGGHLEVLKWLLDQDPPCDFDGEAFVMAARGGHLEVLKWLKDQDLCNYWERHKCREEASGYGYQHIVDWIDQQED
ncbi:putative ankyrin repeat protein [Chloropicon roscoffensis]|uniref:Ankyrin repeat protein n=1 Tax=Chloropicon roscoffensis TaxID=1461544 RepID=A0AAX4PII0_9CHLO